MSSSQKYEIVYSSGVNIWSRTDLSTLSLFYDVVWLPELTSSDDPELIQFARNVGSSEEFRLSAIFVTGSFPFTDKEGRQRTVPEFTSKWIEDNSLLFDAGVIKRLPPPTVDPLEEIFAAWGVSKDFESLLSGISDVLLDIPYQLRAIARSTTVIDSVSSEEEEKEVLFIWRDHAKHLLRQDLKLPSVFITDESKRREKIKSLMAQAAFQYVIPQISELHPEQILEIREKIADTREGFSMHLQKLSAAVDERLAGGEDFTDVSRFAGEVVETQLIADYVEFRRQLKTMKIGKLRSVLDVVGRILEIDAAPWTPKFYGELLKAIGFTALDTVDARSKALTNQQQAFQLMHKTERKASKFRL